MYTIKSMNGLFCINDFYHNKKENKIENKKEIK